MLAMPSCFTMPFLLASCSTYRPESGINPLSQLCIQTEITHVKDKLITWKKSQSWDKVIAELTPHFSCHVDAMPLTQLWVSMSWFFEGFCVTVEDVNG